MSSFRFTGKVVFGKKRGRVLHFPTINLVVKENFRLGFGIYAVRVKTSLGVFSGALYYGPRETFGEKEPSLEIHLLDFERNLYGEDVEIEVLAKIRDVRAFPDVKSLKRQIAEDVSAVRDMLQ